MRLSAYGEAHKNKHVGRYARPPDTSVYALDCRILLWSEDAADNA